ncbi:Uncharacterised protein [Cedecea neteri]|uniref:Uncharacterized protein n=1 Tax=Cedecea neteri TaxID=158822 RepID=A0A2X3J8M8_9ENTR|nr:Uncharacterised protein [Cedecea neteri]
MQQISIEYTLTVKTCIDHIAVFLRNAGGRAKGSNSEYFG